MELEPLTGDSQAYLEHFGPATSTLGRIRTNPQDSDQSTRDTIQEMCRVAQRTARHPAVNAAVQEALAPLPSRFDTKERVKAIYEWVQRQVEFVEDEEVLGRIWGYRPEEAELIVEPPMLLTMPRPMGDCDDQSTLLAAMLLHLPVGVNFVTVAADPSQMDRWSHVYVSVMLPCGERMALDPSHGPYAGWEEKEVFRTKEWVVRRLPVQDCGCQLHGLGGPGSWGDILKTGAAKAIEAGTSLLFPPPGTFISTPQGTIQTAMKAPTAGITTFPPTQFSGAGGDITMWLLIGVGIIVLAKSAR